MHATKEKKQILDQKADSTNQGKDGSEYLAFLRPMLDSEGRLLKKDLLNELNYNGILSDDPRLQEIYSKMRSTKSADYILSEELPIVFRESPVIIEKALTGNLVLPDFESFASKIKDVFHELKNNKKGKVAEYIPQLSRVDPDYFAISICSIDGQRLDLGDSHIMYTAQSTSKPISYCLALDEHGTDVVHQHVGREPSGKGFNELRLNQDGLPHNPMINSGAVMCASMIRHDQVVADRFETVMSQWRRLCGNRKLSFNNSVYLSEKSTADRNFALGYFMKEKKAFPKWVDLLESLDFYFQCCSIELDSEMHASLAASLANSGECPTTGDKIFKAETVKCCLSLMSSCGMYDYSGEFAFKTGLPAKSGVSGIVILVVPNVLGIAIYSPRLDNIGNSVRGIAFSERLLEIFNFHNYDSLIYDCKKIDPRLGKYERKLDSVISLIWAASKGDLREIKKLLARGLNVNTADYDGRTALHLAAADGHKDIVNYLIGQGAKSLKDRWGQLPIDEAKSKNHECIIKILNKI